MSETTETDPRLLALAPGHTWGSKPALTSSDILVNRTKDGFSADARDASRSNPYGRSALRTQVDAVIGTNLTLALEPQADELGVSEDEAAEWAGMVERKWLIASRSSHMPMDAQRKQTFVGLMRTAYACFYVSGEAAGTIEWKMAANGQRTCLNLFDAERISDPRGEPNMFKNRRMGIDRDQHGAPVAYHIREKHPSDLLMGWGTADSSYTWKRVPRYTTWGRPNILHYFEQDRPDMTRGMSSFTTALLPMRLLQDFLLTELETAAVRATYAAVIQSKLNYDDAMKVIGQDHASAIQKNPLLALTLEMMASKAQFYKGQEFSFGKSKVSHLLPDEELKMVQGNTGSSQLKDYASQNLYTLASALGVDYASLTKDYSSTNYSGARAALYDVWRSYEVRRDGFVAGFAWPFFIAWLEEQIALRETIPMLGSKSFYEVKDALCYGTFETWTKPRLDPLKEAQADKVMYEMGALSLDDICKYEGRDWRRVLKQRARQKKLMEDLGLKPEDINPELLMNNPDNKGEGTGSEGGASTGSSGN